jgi:serine/threonine protein kinase
LGLYCDWRDHRQRDSIACFIKALRNSLDALADYYNDLYRSASPFYFDHLLIGGRKYRTPYPHQYTSVDGETVEFKYIKPVFDNRMVFEVEQLPFSESQEDPPPASGRRVIIKFVQRYGRTAHEVLHREGAAPKLLGFDDLVDDWKMVTMEYLSSKDWIMLDEIHQEQRQQYRDKVEEAVSKLHAAGQVHGDIRGANILVPRSSSGDEVVVKFIDYDEAGSPEVATYPRYWNVDTVKRPNDAREGLPLKYTHDKFMVDQIF